ncbi:DinB family protein [Bacillus shivajii]|uniref:DinB family protein n=1 Tax=Bacillus shivajii TaxID=1983719 RepID=UPI001CFAB08B|nr:DinB family protein [Bacillus shivajii]UCZ55130.1 DinB family protein [Bacillus shivajii]
MTTGIKLFQFWRNAALKSIESTSVDQASMIPKGFKNNIHWNAGHILANLDEKLHLYAWENKGLDQRYYDLFLNGTSPKQWENEEVPSFKEVLQKLKEQEKMVTENYEIFSRQQLTKEFRGMKTGEELLQFLVAHDCMHIRLIKGIKYALNK